jgi:hypothetical protein
MTILTGGRVGTSQFTIFFLNLYFKWLAEIVLVGKIMCGFRPPKNSAAEISAGLEGQ